MAEKYQMYIDGEWCDSSTGETFEVISPVTGEVIGIMPKASEEDVERAIKAAHREKENYKFLSDEISCVNCEGDIYCAGNFFWLKWLADYSDFLTVFYKRVIVCIYILTFYGRRCHKG